MKVSFADSKYFSPQPRLLLDSDEKQQKSILKNDSTEKMKQNTQKIA
jgi:hypothetical protein